MTEVATLLIYCAGAVAVLALLTGVAWALLASSIVACNKAARNLLHYRRLSYLNYWTDRLENEGLLSIDALYRSTVAQQGAPKTPAQAEQRERQALQREAEAP